MICSVGGGVGQRKNSITVVYPFYLCNPRDQAQHHGRAVEPTESLGRWEDDETDKNGMVCVLFVRRDCMAK